MIRKAGKREEKSESELFAELVGIDYAGFKASLAPTEAKRMGIAEKEGKGTAETEYAILRAGIASNGDGRFSQRHGVNTVRAVDDVQAMRKARVRSLELRKADGDMLSDRDLEFYSEFVADAAALTGDFERTTAPYCVFERKELSESEKIESKREQCEISMVRDEFAKIVAMGDKMIISAYKAIVRDCGFAAALK